MNSCSKSVKIFSIYSVEREKGKLITCTLNKSISYTLNNLHLNNVPHLITYIIYIYIMDLLIELLYAELMIIFKLFAVCNLFISIIINTNAVALLHGRCPCSEYKRTMLEIKALRLLTFCPAYFRSTSSLYFPYRHCRVVLPPVCKAGDIRFKYTTSECAVGHTSVLFW